MSHCDYCTFDFPLFLKKIRICKPQWNNTEDYDHRRLRTNVGTPCPHPAIPCHSRCSCPAPCPFLPSMPIPAFCCCLLVCCHITKPITRHCPHSRDNVPPPTNKNQTVECWSHSVFNFCEWSGSAAMADASPRAFFSERSTYSLQICVSMRAGALRARVLAPTR